MLIVLDFKYVVSKEHNKFLFSNITIDPLLFTSSIHHQSNSEFSTLFELVFCTGLISVSRECQWYLKHIAPFNIAIKKVNTMFRIKQKGQSKSSSRKGFKDLLKFHPNLERPIFVFQD